MDEDKIVQIKSISLGKEENKFINNSRAENILRQIEKFKQNQLYYQQVIHSLK